MPSCRSWRPAAAAQPRFAAGLAGLGCRIRPIFTSAPGSTALALASAKVPIPMTQLGERALTTSTSARSQAANSGSRSAAGSLSGVRFLPLSSMKQSGQ